MTPELPNALSYEIALRLTNDTEIQALNAQYRQKDQPTDVLAFAALEVDLPQNEEMLASLPLYLGDIVISIDTAKRQADQQEHDLLTELAWLTTHGFLHLLGWDHPDEASLIQMLKQQVVLLKAIGISIDLE
jgi:probable rRNA maturation factor